MIIEKIDTSNDMIRMALLQNQISDKRQELEKENQLLAVSLEPADIHYRHWAKAITQLNPKNKDHEAFVGEFLPVDRPRDLMLGAHILDYQEKRSKTEQEVIIKLYQVIDYKKTGNKTLLYQKLLSDKTNWVQVVKNDIEAFLLQTH